MPGSREEAGFVCFEKKRKKFGKILWLMQFGCGRSELEMFVHPGEGDGRGGQRRVEG